MVFVYLFIIGIPGILVCLSIIKIARAKNICRNGTHTQGVVTQIALLHFSKGSFDNVVLEYQDSNGKYHAAKITTTPGQYNRGDAIPLKYLQHKPSQYIIDGMKQGQWGILIFSALLLAFMIFASFKICELAEGTHYHFSP